MTKFMPLTTSTSNKSFIYNPLNWINEKNARQIIDSARTGRISRLQLLFDLVEQNCLILDMCIQRRTSAMPDWCIRRRDTRRRNTFDIRLAEQQEQFLNEQFARCEDSGTLKKAITTLEMTRFKGIGVVQPIYDEYGLDRIVSLDPWNFAIDYSRHDEYGNYPLYWNPSGNDIIDFENTLQLIPPEQIVYMVNRSPIDSFGLQIFLAQQLGFESYTKLIGRKGLPSTYIVAPQDLQEDDIGTWANKAVECAKGGSGAFPYGTNLITTNIDPNNATAIREFLEYLEKEIVLASTGGSLASLTEATGLGSNTAEVQNDVFRSIVHSDASAIGDTINRGIAARLLDAKFPGRPHLVYFDLANDEKQTPEKYLNDAVIAHNAGLTIDIPQLEDLTGYKLQKTEVSNNTWTVPNEEHKEGTDLWEPKRELTMNDEPTVEQEEPKKPEKEEQEQVAQGTSLLKAFDKMIAPLRVLFQKLFKAKDKEEEKTITDRIFEEIAKIENTEGTQYEEAMQKLMLEAFEEEGRKINE